MDVERAREIIATERPRKLRLEDLLYELGARGPGEPDEVRAPHLTVGELVDKAAEGGFGFLTGVLSLIAIPFFGLSTPFGLAIALIGLQMMLGRTQPWLPKRARRRELKMSVLDRVATILARRTRWIVRSTRRRWEMAIRTRFVGLGIFILALALAMPLPIPGSNLVFLIPIFIYAVGLLERDGLWIIVAYVATLVDIALLFLFGNAVLMVLRGVWDWLT